MASLLTLFSTPTRTNRRCRVQGCTACSPGKPHYCYKCGDRDSTHFSSNCPHAQVNWFYGYEIKSFHTRGLRPSRGGVMIICGSYGLFCRKALGPSNRRPGERHANGHIDKNNCVSPAYKGAAGTKPRYWGTWGTPGGTFDASSSDPFLKELKDETASKLSVGQLRRKLTIVGEITTQNGFVLRIYKTANRDLFKCKSKSKRELLKCSKGEIAEIRWLPLYNPRGGLLPGTKGIADYAERTHNILLLAIQNNLLRG